MRPVTGPWRVVWDPGTLKDLRRLGRTASERIRTAVCTRLSRDPFAGRRLAGAGHTPLFRFRVGDYRIIYTLRQDELLILVLRVGHRREVYRRTP